MLCVCNLCASPHVFGCPVSCYCVLCSKLHADFLLSELFVQILPSTFLDSIRTETRLIVLRFCLVVLSLANVIWGKLKTETDVECAGWEESVCVWGGETKCWSEKVKSLLFFCPTPVARPLPPPLSSQSCSPGERTEGKTYKSWVSRVSPVSALLCKLMYFVCSFAYSWKKKDAAHTKEARIQPWALKLIISIANDVAWYYSAALLEYSSPQIPHPLKWSSLGKVSVLLNIVRQWGHGWL